MVYLVRERYERYGRTCVRQRWYNDAVPWRPFRTRRAAVQLRGVTGEDQVAAILGA